VIHDAALVRLADELAPLEVRLTRIIEDQQRAEEERASRDVLRSVQGALKEALLALPAEEYDWFDLHRGEGKRRPRTTRTAPGNRPAEGRPFRWSGRLPRGPNRSGSSSITRSAVSVVIPRRARRGGPWGHCAPSRVIAPDAPWSWTDACLTIRI
jgi:hypothetical protein